MLEDLPVPLLESESKKLQTAQTKSMNKPTVVPTVEGTSVMPRQRPKGSSANPLNLNNLPLTLSPSPTTVKKSQSPVTFTDNQFARPNLNQPVYPTNVNPNYTAFANSVQFQNSQSFFASKDLKEPSFDTLFHSTIYPDPFREDGTGKVESEESASAAANVEVPISIMSPVTPEQMLVESGGHRVSSQGKLGLMESSSQSMVSSSESPPHSPSLSVPKGHRRNMSDTTAFNK